VIPAKGGRVNILDDWLVKSCSFPDFGSLTNKNNKIGGLKRLNSMIPGK
jgi:hypothetical protein